MEERNIYDEVKKKIQIDFVIGITIALIVMLFFSYAGYIFAVDNELSIVKCILMGATLPLVYLLLKEVWYIGTVGNIVFTLIWMISAFYLPLFIAAIVFLGMIDIDGYFFITYCKEKYQKELQKEEKKVVVAGMFATDKHFFSSHQYSNKKEHESKYLIEGDEEIEEFHCDRCDERISEDEYIDNGGLCDDCYDEVYFGERYEGGDDYDLYR